MASIVLYCFLIYWNICMHKENTGMIDISHHNHRNVQTFEDDRVQSGPLVTF